MSNHLFDALLGARANDSRCLIRLTTGATLSWADLHALSGRYANLLIERGVEPGARVAVQIDKSPEAIALYLASVRAGAVFLPLNTAYTGKEIEYFIDDAEPALFVCDPARTDEFAGLDTTVLTLDAAAGGSFAAAAEMQPTDFDTIARAPDDLAAILYTSGTTGLSKGAMLSHDNLLSNSLTLVEYWRFDEGDVLLHALPIFHTHGLFVATNVVLLAGASMIFLPRFDLEAMLAQLPKSTALMGVPTFYTRLLADSRFDRELVAHMRLFVSGSAPLLSETHVDFEARTGHRILERYGMTETNMNTSNPYDGERRAGTVGLALPGIEIRVTDPESGAPLARGETGMVEVRGPNVFQGYWRKPDKTAQEFRDDGYFITGDMGVIDTDGYLQIVGREKDLIISGGYNVYPKQIETEIDALDGVVESAVFGAADPDLGEIVAAAVVREVDAGLDADAIIDAIRPALARFKLPRRIEFVDELPRNAMGKVQKNLLRERYG